MELGLIHIYFRSPFTFFAIPWTNNIRLMWDEHMVSVVWLWPVSHPAEYLIMHIGYGQRFGPPWLGATTAIP